MTHIDLFSGIGGFAYAAKQVWPDYHNLFFCDNNKFCQAVLRKNFGQDSLIYGDIREVTVEGVIADTEIGEREARLQDGSKHQERKAWEIGGRRSWGIPWLEVATRLCRVDDGLPAGVDGNAKGIPGGYKVKPGGEIGEYLISKSKHREERLKALGNAIVPQVAVEIMKAILMKP